MPPSTSLSPTPGDPHDAKGFVKDWFTWTIPALREMVELWVELIGNRDMIPYLGNPSVNALRHSFPFAPSNLLRRTGPVMRDTESRSAWSIFTANLWMRLFGADDEFVRVEGGEGEDAQIASWTLAIRRFFKMPGHQHVLYKMLGDVSCTSIGWCESTVSPRRRMRYTAVRRDLEMQQQAQPQGPMGGPIPFPNLQGMSMEDIDFQPRLEEWFDHKLEHIHPFDFHPDWSKPLGYPMTGGALVGRMAMDEFKAFVEQYEDMDDDPEGGFYESNFDRAIAKNGKEYHTRTNSEGERWRELAIRNLTEEDIQLPDRFRPLMFHKYIGEVPWHSDRNDRARYRMIIILNDELILNVKQPYYPHPWRCIQLPPQTGSLTGMSPLHTLRYHQDELDTWMNLRTKAGIRTINAPTLVDTGAFDDEGIAMLDEPSSDQNIPLRPGANPATAAYQMDRNYAPIFTVAQMIQDQKGWAREGIGLPDIMRGVAAGARTTRREIDELSVSGNMPMDVNTDLIENHDLPYMAEDVGQQLFIALRDMRSEGGQPTYDQELQKRLGDPGVKLAHFDYSPSIIFQGAKRFRAWSNLPAVSNIIFQFVQMFPEAAPMVVPGLITSLLRSASPGHTIRQLEQAITMATAGNVIQGQKERQMAAMGQAGSAASKPGQASAPRPRGVQ